MSEFGVALLTPVVKPFGLRPEKLFLPLGMCLVHSMFMLGVWTEIRDQEEPSAFMHGWIGSEWLAILAGLYLLLVFVGPQLMASLEPADIKEAMVIYNLYQTGINAVMVACLVGSAIMRAQAIVDAGGEWGLWNQPVAGTPALMVFGLYLHYNNKFVEYLDTIFMVLRHKNQQLTFLHCWHHFIMGFAWFSVLRNAAGGVAWYGSSANSMIHVIMYGYYGLASLGFKLPVWVKAFVTQSQLIQFCLVASQSAFLLYRFYAEGVEIYPTWLTLLQLGVMVNMFVMFFGFYMRAYCSKRKEA